MIRRFIRHPVGWLLLCCAVMASMYVLYWDQQPCDVVKQYVQDVTQGKWQEATKKTVGNLQVKLQGQLTTRQLDRVSKATVLQESYTLHHQDMAKQVSTVYAEVVLRLADGKLDVQKQTYSLYRGEDQAWKIYRVDAVNQVPTASHLYPVFAPTDAKELLLSFLRASALGNWKQVEQTLTGTALQQFEKTKAYLPKKWAQAMEIEPVKVQYIGHPFFTNEYEYLVQYKVKRAGKEEQITARMTLVQWAGSLLIARTDIIQGSNV
ncbi:hypothetical protein [Aneurinibacillus aneurinilyticus]|uniref:hypothetical protein n=1 Tax=Aneurinibacillus aneurinilyticus TaxID=1391 RepID=UPI0023F0CC94|nr:hypothetical protein [Aneurinibacillus aneurinilyticus]